MVAVSCLIQIYLLPLRAELLLTTLVRRSVRIYLFEPVGGEELLLVKLEFAVDSKIELN